MIKYSLIIPFYNDHLRLQRLLKTLPENRPDIEILVVDDCSPKKLEFNTSNNNYSIVKWLSTPENSGAGVARNVGLSAAKGQWLIFADSDDEFLPKAFETFDQVIRVDDELVYFLADAVQEANGSPSFRAERMNKLVDNHVASPSTNTLHDLRVQHVVPWAKVYSRKFIDSLEICFDPVRISNDVAFNVLAAVQSNKLRAVAIPVYRVYHRAGSLTAETSSQDLIERLKVIGRLNDRLRERGLKERMHAASYIARAPRFGPLSLIKVFKITANHKMLWPTFRRLNPREILQFIKHCKKRSIEKNLYNEN